MYKNVLKNLKNRILLDRQNTKPMFITNQHFVQKVDSGPVISSESIIENNNVNVYKNLNEMITVAMCTQPSRKKQMLRTVEILLPQCDRMCICFNEYSEIPKELPKSNKLVCVLAGKNKQYKDLGCMNKMLWCGVYPGYYAVVDDDIEYCDGYIEFLKSKVDLYNKECICSLHGHLYPILNGCIDYDKRKVLCYDKDFKNDVFCHRIGNGCSMFYPSKINLKKDIFLDKEKNFGDDEVLAIWAQENHVPLVKVENKGIIVNESPIIDQSTGLYNNKRNHNKRKKYLESYKNWNLYTYQKDCFFRIVIPTFNSENFISKCIYSIIKQTYQDFKIIIVDDCSTDNTRDCILKLYSLFPDKIIYKFCDERCYAGKCRNIALDIDVKTEYTLFLDSDDYYYNECVLENIHKSIIENKNPDLLKCSFYTCESKVLSKPKIIGDKFTDIIKLFSPWTTCIKSILCPKFKEDRIRFNDVIWSLKCYDKIETFYTIKMPCVVYNLNNNPNSCQHAKMDRSRIAALYYLMGDLLNCNFKKQEVIQSVQKVFKMKMTELMNKNFYIGMIENEN